MTEHGAGLVTAEVLLRRRSAADKVVRFLQEQGVQVSSVGAASISIRCDRVTFERVFKVTFKDTPEGGAPKGVRDFGTVGREAVEPEGPATVPDAITDEVEGVYVQQRPRLL